MFVRIAIAVPNLKSEQFAENDNTNSLWPRDFGDECLQYMTVGGSSEGVLGQFEIQPRINANERESEED